MVAKPLKCDYNSTSLYLGAGRLMRNIAQLDLANRRVVIRVDFNVPIRDGKVSCEQRLCAALPTIRFALNQGAGVILLSHLGRPVEGHEDRSLSLEPVVQPLTELLGMPVRFARDWLDGVTLEAGELVLCENVRMQQGEKVNDERLAQKIAKLGDIFVMDAFATAHRAHASTAGAIVQAETACAGLLLQAEIKALSQVMQQAKKPVMAIVGGAKVSSKLSLLRALLEQVDLLIVGGGIANTFLAAQGLPIGNSLYEESQVQEAGRLLMQAESLKTRILVPQDVRVGTKFSADATAQIKCVQEVMPAEMILDVGPKTSAEIAECLLAAGTILWNGPLGVFEFPAFAAGTASLALAVAKSQAFSVAGGGDTLAAIAAFEVTKHLSYISTGGGAFLQYIEGKPLPALQALNERRT